jgi:hypothetical protein
MFVAIINGLTSDFTLVAVEYATCASTILKVA